MLIAFAGFALFSLAMVIIYFKEKPPTPPSINTEEAGQNTESLGFWKGIKILCTRSPNYIFTLVGAALLLGTLAYGYTALIG